MGLQGADWRKVQQVSQSCSLALELISACAHKHMETRGVSYSMAPFVFAIASRLFIHARALHAALLCFPHFTWCSDPRVVASEIARARESVTA